MTQLKVSRRHFVFGGLALAGCGESKLARTVVDAYQVAIVGRPDVPISRSTVTNLPYASIAAKIGKGPRSLLILWRQDQDDLHWLSADDAAIVTRNGRVVKTAGLPETLVDTRSISTDPVGDGLSSGAQGPTYVREIDTSPPPQFGLLIESKFREVGPRRLSIADIEFDTVLFHEHCRAKTLNWSFTNRYWVDPADGFVWRSEQTIARNFPSIEIEILKPAA
jgi:hypothetical protein